MLYVLSLLSQALPTLKWLEACWAQSNVLGRVIRTLSLVAAHPLPKWTTIPAPLPDRLAPVRAALLAVLLVAAARPASAGDAFRDIGYRGQDGSTHMIADGNLVDVQVRVEGREAPLFFRPGRSDRHYFQAFKGRNYSLVVHNNTGRRVGVLISVDGLNVVNGERSSLSHDEPMYVLDPYEDAVIKGWRTSLDEVRRFVFVDEDRSYAERTGQANGDMGWIRVLSFREIERRVWWDRLGRSRGWDDERSDAPAPRDRRDYAEPQPQAKGETREGTPAPEFRAKGEARDGQRAPESFRAGPSAPESNPGTGWGERRRDVVEQTVFAAERSPSDQMVLRYEYANGLTALGIFPRRFRLWDREEGELGFAQPPRW